MGALRLRPKADGEDALKRVYFLSYLEWMGDFNAARCESFEARTNAEAREKAASLFPTRRASWVWLKCVTTRHVKL